MVDPIYTIELEESQIEYIMDGLMELKKTIGDDLETKAINDILGILNRALKED